MFSGAFSVISPKGHKKVLQYEEDTSMLISANAYLRRTNAYWYSLGGVVKQEYEKRVQKRVRRIGQVDLETGELLKGFATWTEVKYSPYNRGWYMQSQEALVSLAQDREITGECYRVLFILLA